MLNKKKFIKKMKILAVQRRATNIKSILVGSLILKPSNESGSYPCGEKCSACPYMKTVQEFKSSQTNKTYAIKGHYTCKSASIIYLITCKKCNIQYVGQSGNSFRERFYGHSADIRAKNDVKPVSCHFLTHDVSNMNIIIIQTTTRNTNIWLRTEEVWINNLKTKHPEGLNII